MAAERSRAERAHQPALAHRQHHRGDHEQRRHRAERLGPADRLRGDEPQSHRGEEETGRARQPPRPALQLDSAKR